MAPTVPGRTNQHELSGFEVRHHQPVSKASVVGRHCGSWNGSRIVGAGQRRSQRSAPRRSTPAAPPPEDGGTAPWCRHRQDVPADRRTLRHHHVGSSCGLLSSPLHELAESHTVTPQNEGPAPKFHHFTGRLRLRELPSGSRNSITYRDHRSTRVPIAV